MNIGTLQKEFKKDIIKTSFMYLLEIFNKEKISNFNNKIFDNMIAILEKQSLDINETNQSKKTIINSIIKEEIMFFLFKENPFDLSILFYDFNYHVNLNKCILEISNYKPYHKELVFNFLKNESKISLLINEIRTNPNIFITNDSFFYDKTLYLEFYKNDHNSKEIIDILNEELNKSIVLFFETLKTLEVSSIKFKNLSIKILKILFKNNLIDRNVFENSLNNCFYKNFIKNKKSLDFSLGE